MTSASRAASPKPYASWRRCSTVLLLAITAAACSAIGGNTPRPGDGPHLARMVAVLPPLQLPRSEQAVPDQGTVFDAYAAIAGKLPDRDLNQAVTRRMADLTMSLAEDQDADGRPRPYDDAIARYMALLEETEGSTRADVIYQLARAYDLAGQPAQTRIWLDQLINDHPDHPLLVEAHFRRAEMAFSEERHTDAETDYAFVVTEGRGSPWWLNATYMSGWSRFKAGDADGALVRFFAVLDRVGPDQIVSNQATQTLPGDAADNGPESAGERELRHDTLRVTTLALDYLDGPQTLAASMRHLGRPHWQFALYATLAENYLTRDRYLDSVLTWQTFIDEQPMDPRAPGAHRRVIDILHDADFPTEARESQSRFVAAYGIDSDFWQSHDDVRDSYLPALKTYLYDLAQNSHVSAQQAGERGDFARAAHWYENLIRTFPQDPDIAGYLFMLGEIHTEAGEPEHAVAAYRRVMREFPDHPDAAEAGYAAVIGLRNLAEQAGSTAEAATDSRAQSAAQIAAQIEFVNLFPADPRAPAVSAAAAEGLFAQGDLAAAIHQAEQLLADNPALEPGLQQTALTVLGHGHFEADNFAAAERAYRELISAPIDAVARNAATERLLAAIYRQGELSERAGAIDDAIAHYLRLDAVDPDAELTIQARYDAIAVLETNDRIAEAAQLLDDFRKRHGHHRLAADAPRRLATLYEQTDDPRLANAAWLEVAASDQDPEVRRQALYRAAELTLQTDDHEAAVRYFTDYVERYPRPADLAMEALDHLDRSTRASQPSAQHNRWLVAKIDLENAMRNEGATDTALARAADLAAAAQYELARHARDRFDSVHLVSPLSETLQRKQQALREALAGFEAAAAYQVAQYVTASTWQIGELYAGLAVALMQSERPTGLSALELEQYEMLLEEQAFPFEEQAIALHEINVRRSWTGSWDPWIERSFAELRRLVPARFDRPESAVANATDPASCDARTERAVELRRQGEFDAAEQHYLACLADRPDYGLAYLNLGILYELYLGRLDQALDAYRRYQALAGQPDPRVTHWMQDIERRTGV